MHQNLSFGRLFPMILAVALLACSDSTGPETAKVDGLKLTLSLEPSSVEQHGSTDVTLTVRNRRPYTAKFESNCTSLAFLGLFRDGERVNFRGSNFGCNAAITPFEIPAYGTLQRRWTIFAEDRLENPVERGTYTVRTDFHVPGWNDLEQILRVK